MFRSDDQNPAARGIAPASILSASVLFLVSALASAHDPTYVLDLANPAQTAGNLIRTQGSVGNGHLGLPVSGAMDCNDDGFNDWAVGFMLADPMGRTNAGEVNLVFGTGAKAETVDTGIIQNRVLRFIGDDINEAAGSEVWMDDVTGDGLGDLLICRQNHSPGGRIGAGALSIIVGGDHLTDFADTLATFDLRTTDSEEVIVTTILGATTGGRLAIWTRTGDVDGDGTADIIVAADQAASHGLVHSGEAWLIAGGAHLASGGVIDLASFGSTPLAGNILRILPPPASAHYHLGATNFIADLDGNDRGEVMLAAALNRSGASIIPDGASGATVHSSGGATPAGALFILWDDNVPARPWASGLTISFGLPPGNTTRINGDPAIHRSFGEEVLGGLDFDNNGSADLYIGDLVALAAGRPVAGISHVFYNPIALKGQIFGMVSPPPGVMFNTILGPRLGALGGDTATQGDFDNDGIDDLAIGSPHDDPLGRNNAGSVHILFGKNGQWPALIDTAPGLFPDPALVRIAEVRGALGGVSGDTGDTLCYSGASGDVDGDGVIDLIVNEMVGNGATPGAIDTGNLIIIQGPALAAFPLPTPTPEPSASPSPNPTGTPTPTPSPTPACCPGDANNSGSFVDANDFISVQANFGADNGFGGPGDANCSGGFVDANDFIAVQANFGADCG